MNKSSLISWECLALQILESLALVVKTKKDKRKKKEKKERRKSRLAENLKEWPRQKLGQLQKKWRKATRIMVNLL